MCRIIFTAFLITFSLSVYYTPIRLTAICFGGSNIDELLDLTYAPDRTLVVSGSTLSADCNFPTGTPKILVN